jgi:hypothetical protein
MDAAEYKHIVLGLIFVNTFKTPFKAVVTNWLTGFLIRTTITFWRIATPNFSPRSLTIETITGR